MGGMPGAPVRVGARAGRYPSLAISRAFGDAWAKDIGVVATPDIVRHPLMDDKDGQDLFTVLASDGVWDHLSNEEVCALVMKNKTNLSKAVDAIVKESTDRWKSAHNGEYIDDITVVLAVYQPKL